MKFFKENKRYINMNLYYKKVNQISTRLSNKEGI